MIAWLVIPGVVPVRPDIQTVLLTPVVVRLSAVPEREIHARGCPSVIARMVTSYGMHLPREI